jgi:predicted aspartyl protease
MGTFHVGSKLENHTDRKQAVTVPRALVDTGSEYTWIPLRTLEKIGVNREKKDLLFTMANGQTITRSVGFAILQVDKYFTIDEVIFAEPGDMTLLGARTLEGLSLVVDARRKKLVAAGPLPAA